MGSQAIRCMYLILIAQQASVIFGQEYVWTSIHADQFSVRDALFGGMEDDVNNNIMYAQFVGRAMVNAELLPIKCLYSNQGGLAGCRGVLGNEEITIEDGFEYLVGLEDKFSWIRTSSDNPIHPNAIKGGDTATGGEYFIGRAKHDGMYQTIGKINAETKLLYTSNPYVKIWSSYEILVWDTIC